MASLKPSMRIKEFHQFLISLYNLVGLQLPEVVICHPRLLVITFVGVSFIPMIINGCLQSLDNPYKLLHALVPVAIVALCLSRIFNLFYRNYQEFNPLMIRNIVNFYEKYEGDPRYSSILTKRAYESEFYTKALMYCSFLFYYLPTFISLGLYFIFGQKLLCINNYLPYTDPNKTFDFFSNLTIIAISTPVPLFALLVLDTAFVFFGYQIVPLCDILCGHLDELSEKLVTLRDEIESFQEVIEETNLINKVSPTKSALEDRLRELEETFVDIIKEHRSYDLFIKDLIFYSEIPCFFTVMINALSIGICIVEFFGISRAMGTAGVAVFTSQVITPCLMGTLITTQNTRIADKLIDFPWYNMSKTKQKIFLQYVHMVQKTTEFVMPVFGYAIDLQAFADVLNVSYSYFTMFWNMTKRS